MSEENLVRHHESEWFEFWRNLKEGFDLFEATGIPPEVRVENGRYAFDGGAA